MCADVPFDGPDDELDPLLRHVFGRQPSPPGDSASFGGEGDQVPGDRYVPGEELGRGGMGVVVEAEDRTLRRAVAIKFLKDETTGISERRQRFVEEARIAGQLQHPGIVPVYDLSDVDSERPYFTMKLVRGETLKEQIERRPDNTHDRQRFLEVFRRICEAIAYAHASGVIHRDIKPSNVMVGTFGEVYLMDWGLAKVLGRSDQDSGANEPQVQAARPEPRGWESLSGSVFGTPAYMSPEQARGEVAELDMRSDVFSLGAVLCEILTGEPPYQGASAAEIRERAIHAELDLVWRRLKASGCEAELLAITRACLSVEPEDRPKDAGALATRISEFLSGVEERAREAELDAAAARAHASQERRVKRITLGFAVTVIILLLAGGGAYLLYEADQYARTTKTNRAVQGALVSARDARSRALANPDEPLATWSAALEAAERAAALASTGGADAETRTEAQETRDQIAVEAAHARRDAEQLERDRSLVRRLDEIRILRVTDLDRNRTDAAYADAFRAIGIDVDDLDLEKAVGVISKTTVGTRLAAVLDDWAAVRRSVQIPADTAWRDLFELAQRVDLDQERTRIRQAFHQGRHNELKTLAEARTTLSMPLATLHMIAEDLSRAFGPVEALRLLRKVHRAHPEDIWTNWYMGGYLMDMKPPRPEDAVAFYQAALSLLPDSFAIRVNLAHAHRKRGAPGPARELLEDAVASNPDHPMGHYALGVTFKELGDAGLAEESLARAVHLDPEFVGAIHALGSLVSKQGRFKEAARHFRKVIDLNPRQVLAWFNLGSVQISLRNDAEAEKAFRAALDLDPDHAFSHNGLSGVLSRKGDLAQARKHLERALELLPKHHEFHYNLANLLYAAGDLSGAIERHKKAIEFKPDYPQALVNMGQMMRLVGRFDEALTALERGHELSRRVKNWRTPTERLIAECRQNIETEKTLQEVLADRLVPETSEDWINLAAHCRFKNHSVQGVTVWVMAFKARGQADARLVARRYDAAQSAALAGGGFGQDAGGLDAAEYARLRGLAMGWLRAELTMWSQAVDRGGSVRGSAVQRAERCVADRVFAGLRGESLKALPDDERKAWKGFWSDVDALLKRADG